MVTFFFQNWNFSDFLGWKSEINQSQIAFYISGRNCGEELLSIHEKFCFGPDHEEKNQMIENPEDNTICINPDNGKTENWLSVSHCEACEELSFFELDYYQPDYSYDGYEYKPARKGMVSFKNLFFVRFELRTLGMNIY